VHHYWGAYFAAVRNDATGTHSILRDPTANLACYHAKLGSIHVFFSDMEDFVRYVPLSLSVNWRHIRTRLYAGFLFSRDCAIAEIEDIPGGEWMTISSASETREMIWHPAQFCVDDPMEDECRAASELRATVVTAVHSVASEHDNLLVLLSGGLDSSIITSCLAQDSKRRSVTCLNFFVAGDTSGNRPETISIPGLSRENLVKLRRSIGNADEREYARKVADKCGFRLVEMERPVRDLDFERLYAAPPAPRPTGYAFALDVDDGELECAVATGATACISGQGGDSVFYASQRVIGALDYAISHPFGSDLGRQIGSAATLSRESLVRVLGKVIKYGYLRFELPPLSTLSVSPNLLTSDALSALSTDISRHPWIDAATHLCPGKRNHVRGITDSVPLYHRTFRRERIAPSIHPLGSQPVVETCLRIPTYVLLADGRSRGLARRAFRDILPREVSERFVKGTGMSLAQNLVRRNMTRIKEHLLDGPLVQEHILDRRKLEAYLIDEQPFLTVQAPQIIDYLTCHAWLTQLRSRR